MTGHNFELCIKCSTKILDYLIQEVANNHCTFIGVQRSEAFKSNVIEFKLDFYI